jgi:CAAX prenyl protease-like protein
VATGVVLWHFRGVYAAWNWRPTWFAWLIGGGVFAIWLFLERLQGPGEVTMSFARLEEHGLAWAVTWTIFRVLGSVLTIPIAEELAFRGYLLRRFISNDVANVPAGQFTWFSFIASSVLFGALHSRWLAGSIAGMLFALALYRHGRLADAVWAHMIANLLIAGYVLVTGDWTMWE